MVTVGMIGYVHLNDYIFPVYGPPLVGLEPADVDYLAYAIDLGLAVCLGFMLMAAQGLAEGRRRRKWEQWIEEQGR